MAKTEGWIGIGLSYTGQMTNSDIFIGWIDDTDSKVYLEDRYTKSDRIEPFYDINQSLTLLHGSQINGVTKIRFMRKKTLCNFEDHAITSGTMRIIFAYSQHNSDLFGFHGAINRGSKSMNLFSDSYLLGENDTTNSAIYDNYFDLTVNNTNTITNKTGSLYYCKLFKIPKFNATQYAIRYDALIKPGNEAMVHHILIFSCPVSRVTSEAHVNTEGICDEWDENMPSKYCRTGRVLHAFGVGTNNFWYPQHVGIGIGPNTDIEYVFLEMHYENNDLLNNVVDTSGVRVWYTPNARNYSASAIAVGIQVGHPSYQFIPHGISRIINYGYCLSSCTRLLPVTGVKIFSVFLHAHYLGAVIKLRIIRNGVELRPILVEHAYDFNYQNTVKIDERDFLPNDSLIVECHYNSLHYNYTNVTFGGDESLDEMCLAIIQVYPAVEITGCVTDFALDDVVEWTEIATEKHFLSNVEKGRKYWRYRIDMNGSLELYRKLWSETYKRRLMCANANFVSLLPDVSNPYDYIPEYDGFELYNDECEDLKLSSYELEILNFSSEQTDDTFVLFCFNYLWLSIYIIILFYR
eukprot:464906_1